MKDGTKAIYQNLEIDQSALYEEFKIYEHMPTNQDHAYYVRPLIQVLMGYELQMEQDEG
jgi:hypothetical protein